MVGGCGGWGMGGWIWWPAMLGIIGLSSFFCKIMGNFVAIPFQMLK